MLNVHVYVALRTPSFMWTSPSHPPVFSRHYIMRCRYLLVLFLDCVIVNAFSQTNTAQTRPSFQLEPSPPLSTTNDAVVHLYSLHFNETLPPLSQIWKWKDQVLGNGRDFFVPKPKTLQACIKYIQQSIPHHVSSCVVISNCARLELLLVLHEECDLPQLENEVTRCILAQVHQPRHSSTTSSSSILDSLLVTLMDRPEQIHANAILSNKEQHDVASIKWTRIVGVEQVCRHLCLVAAGMATRPNRPHRPVFFRPFSSRDAHILLQLKRVSEVQLYQYTKVVAAVVVWLLYAMYVQRHSYILLLLLSRTQVLATSCSNDGSAGLPVAKLLLDASLTAGKAARDVTKVPAIAPLQQYGSGASRYYSSEPPAALTQAATEVSAFTIVILHLASLYLLLPLASLSFIYA